WNTLMKKTVSPNMCNPGSGEIPCGFDIISEVVPIKHIPGSSLTGSNPNKENLDMPSTTSVNLDTTQG
ncbi:hypothetical protein HAX54_007449, partial [Datura stramonium]|nr:hypothetical protein [Datura stramonium]